MPACKLCARNHSEDGFEPGESKVLLALAMQGAFEVIEHALTPRGLRMRAQA